MKKVICIKNCSSYLGVTAPQKNDVCTVLSEHIGTNMAGKVGLTYILEEFPHLPGLGWSAAHFRDIEPMDVDAILNEILKHVPNLEPLAV